MGFHHAPAKYWRGLASGYAHPIARQQSSYEPPCCEGYGQIELLREMSLWASSTGIWQSSQAAQPGLAATTQKLSRERVQRWLSSTSGTPKRRPRQLMPVSVALPA